MKPYVHSFDLYETLISKRDGDEDVIQIEEMKAKITPEDIIVSDMYLPEYRLRELCGLSNRIFLSNQGKLDGTIWPKVLEEYNVIDHTGDNPHSDVDSPQSHGIPGILCTISERSNHEADISTYSKTLSRVMRETRLSTWHQDPSMRQLQLCQIEANFPILFLSSILLDRRLEEEHVLMCSRDCFLWKKLQEIVRVKLESKYTTEYFHISRLSQFNTNPAYLEYVNNRLPNAVIVDLGGTGRSTTNLLKNTIKANAKMIFLLQYKCSEGKEFDTSHIESLVTDVAEADLERVNNAPHPMLGLGGIGDFNPCNIPWDVIPEIKVQHAAFDTALEILPRYSIDTESNDIQLSEALRKCCIHLKSYDRYHDYINALRLNEEREVEKYLNQG